MTRSGFKTATSSDVELLVQQSMRQDFTLEVGQVTQTVTVEATGTLLQAENAPLGTVVENAAINELPLNGRNYLSLVALSSNVNTNAPASGQASARMGTDRATQSISVGGQRIMWDYYTLDGVNNTDPDFVTYVALPSLDGIQEFKVQTGVYSAEFGHEATQVNVVSKSGTNTYHGSMYDFIRNNTRGCKSLSGSRTTPPPSRYTPSSGTTTDSSLTEPSEFRKLYNGKDKFFFMVDDEWRKIRQTNLGSATLPSPAIAGGNFTGFTTAAGAAVTIYDPATADANGLGKTPFPNNTIPSSRIAPQSLAVLKYLGTSTTPFYSGGSGGRELRVLPPGTTEPPGLDPPWRLLQSQKVQYAFRYSSGNEDIVSTGLLGAGSKIVSDYYQYMGSNTWTITPHIVNEARFGYTHFITPLACCRHTRRMWLADSASRGSRAAPLQRGAFRI